MRTQLASALLATILTCGFFTAPANAQAPRTFVSAAGTDNSTCSFAAPCRHFQAAVNATSAGGEVDALDPAGYGPITITQAITIEGQGWSYIAPPAGGNGITINAGNGNVTIRGVSLNGAGITGGTNGIVFNSGDSLTVTNCVAQNFVGGTNVTANGILIQPISGTISFVITNTIVSNNDTAGIFYQPPSGSFATASGVIDHIVATDNGSGIGVYTALGGSSATVAISNSVTSNNTTAGINIANTQIQPAPALTVSIDNTNSSNNNFYGIYAVRMSNVILGRSVITANANVGVANFTTPNSFYSYQDNRINGNGTSPTSDVAGMMISNALK